MNKMFVRGFQTLRGLCLLLVALLFAPSNSQLSASEPPVPKVSYWSGSHPIQVTTSKRHLLDDAPLVTNITHKIVIFPMYIPLTTSAAWTIFVDQQIDLMANGVLSDWPIVAQLEAYKMIVGNGSLIWQGRIGFGVAIVRNAPSDALVSPSMVLASLWSSDPSHFINLGPSDFSLPNYGNEVRGLRADGTWQTNGSPTDKCVSLFWSGGPAAGIVANDAATFNAAIAYIGYWRPNISATINVVNGSTLVATGKAAVYTDLAMPKLQVGRSPHGMHLTLNGSPNAVHVLTGRSALVGEAPNFLGVMTPSDDVFFSFAGAANQLFQVRLN